MRATILQLAAFAGKSERTVRRYLASGKWPHKVLPGGLIEIDDSLIEPESEQGAILAALARIEEKLDRLSADVGNLATKESKPQVTRQSHITANLPPAQGELQEGLQNWREFAKQRGYSETSIQRWIDEGKVPVHRGNWRGKRGPYHTAIDEAGMRAIDRLYGG